jgi:hypothetical protein
MGLFNSKNKKIDTEITYQIISELSILPLQYKGDLNRLKNQLNIILLQFPEYYKNLTKYFIDCKLKYFKDGSYDYTKFPPDIRSYSILERYNKIIKNELGIKRVCNWVIFMIFINKEIFRINDLLGKNENINVIYSQKNTKFGKQKYKYNKYQKNEKELKNKHKNISENG